MNGLEQAVNDMNDPKVIYYKTTGNINSDDNNNNNNQSWLDCTTNTTDFVDYIHPTVQGNEKFATQLLQTMTDDVRRFFPEKCGGSGIFCKKTVVRLPPSLSIKIAAATAIYLFVLVLFLFSAVGVCRCRLLRRRCVRWRSRT